MNTEQQDKLWNELSEVFQRHYREDYLFLCNERADTSFREGEIKGIKMTMESIFGTHNLKPEPKLIKKEGWVNVYNVINNIYEVTNTVYETEKEAIKYRANDCIATVKIEWEEWI